MNENMKGVSIARGKLLFTIDINSTCKSNAQLESLPESTALNQAYLQCAFLIPEALSRYTGNRRQYSITVQSSHTSGGLYFSEAPG